jgi:hypothetical protein
VSGKIQERQTVIASLRSQINELHGKIREKKVRTQAQEKQVQQMMSGPPILKNQFSVENMLNLNQQNLRLKAHVIMFIEKLEGFIGKAHVMKEEKRK